VTSAAVHVDQLYAAVPGGIGTYVRELVPALARRDPAPALMLFHARMGDRPDEEWTRRFRIEEIRWPIRALYPAWDLLARPPLPPACRSTEVVHATNPAAIPPAGPHQRLVVTVHDVAFERYPRLFPPRWRWLYRAGLRAAVRRADAVITPSRSTADDVLSRTGARPERVHVVPLAAALPSIGAEDRGALERLRIPWPYVLFVGTLEPRKNLVRLVRAYRRVAADVPHSLVLAGGIGWQSDELLAELRRDGPGRIVLPGRLTGPDLDAVLHSASCFAYPSLYEGFGLPVLEAMARGVPVVTSDTSSLPEVAGDAALLVDPRSELDIGEAIARVLDDAGLAARLADAGRARASRFSWDETARRTLLVYEGGAAA
jgi:glycosyltransferase involved in cell wall biosynthesis